MQNTAANAFIYTNLKTLSDFNNTTKLCIFEPQHKLYIVKRLDISCLAYCKSIAMINNAHLAKIVYIDEKPDYIEIVREYISGDTLADLISKGHSLPGEKAIRIAADVCDGLSELHKCGIVHRDVNPNNIIVSSDGCAKIIDFGIVRSFSESKSKDTAILGTPGYAAPEQFGFSQSDARTDIYAVGVLLNVMLTGKLPNEKAVQGEFGRIIRKCTEIDSRQRYKSMDDLKNAVNHKVPGESPMDRAIRQVPGLRSRYPVIIILSILGYIAAMIFSIAIFATVNGGLIHYIYSTMAWILCFPIPFFCFNNFLDIWNRLPFSSGSSKRNQRLVYTVFGILSILFGLIIFGTTYQPPIPTL